VLADLDSSLGAWLADALPARTEVDFGSPDDLPADKSRRAIVNLFLYSVEADTSGLAAADVRLRDPDGRVRSARLPIRHYAVTYLVSARAGDPAEEHRLLGAVLVAHATRDTLDGECLRGALAGVDAHIPIMIGTGQVQTDQLDGPRRTNLTLTVVVPVFPAPVTDIAPPAENLDLVAGALRGGAGATTPPAPPGRWRRTTRTEP
jgi:hypothetical protein